jgi:hypothetical protein
MMRTMTTATSTKLWSHAGGVVPQRHALILSALPVAQPSAEPLRR